MSACNSVTGIFWEPPKPDSYDNVEILYIEEKAGTRLEISLISYVESVKYAYC